jgi:hypothetical protein
LLERGQQLNVLDNEEMSATIPEPDLENPHLYLKLHHDLKVLAQQLKLASETSEQAAWKCPEKMALIKTLSLLDEILAQKAWVLSARIDKLCTRLCYEQE